MPRRAWDGEKTLRESSVQNGQSQGCPDPKEYLHLTAEGDWDGLDSSGTQTLLRRSCRTSPGSASLAVNTLLTALVCFQPLYRGEDLFFARGVFFQCSLGSSPTSHPVRAAACAAWQEQLNTAPFQECLCSSSRTSPGSVGRGGFMEMMSQSSSDAAPRLEEMKEAQGSCRNAPGLLQPLLRAPLSRPGCPPWLPARRGSREAPAGAGMGTAGTSGCPQLLPLRISWRIRLYPGPGDDLQPL